MSKVKVTLIKGKAKPSEPITAHDPVPGTPEWDALCKKCGKCCFDKLVDEEDNLIAATPCEHLDQETGLCLVYENRFTVCPDCIKLTLENLPTFDWLPDDCGYVEYFKLREKNKEWE